MTAPRRLLAPALSVGAMLILAGPAPATTKLYHGTIRIVLSTGASDSYSIPFGKGISYPDMNNLPNGHFATVSGSAPAAIGLGVNQMKLKTALFSASPPPSCRCDAPTGTPESAGSSPGR